MFQSILGKLKIKNQYLKITFPFRWLMYCMYSQKQRGHLFHFSQFIKMMCPRNQPKQNPILKQNIEIGSKDEKDSLVHNGSTV